MYDGNLGEIDFGSSKREVRVTEGSSYRESTVIMDSFILICGVWTTYSSPERFYAKPR